MSSSQVGRLGRRALPLAQQLYAAPGALQQFSSVADAAPGSGMGRGAARDGGSSGPRAPGSGQQQHGGRGRGGPRGPRGDGGEGPQGFRPRGPRHREGGSVRQPGAMSELLQSRGGGAPAAAGAGGREPELSAEYDDSPHDIILNFEYALKDLSNPEAPPVSLDDIAGLDVSDLADMDHLALIRYYIKPGEWDSFCSGNMSLEDQNALMDKLASALLVDGRERDRRAAVKAAIDADPDYDLAASLSARPQLRGSPRPAPPTAEEIAQQLEQYKVALMQQYSLTEEEYQAVKEATVQQELKKARDAARPPLSDYTRLERRLTALLAKRLPSDHPNYAAVQQRLQVLQSNPGWSQERKMVFAKRLIKQMA